VVDAFVRIGKVALPPSTPVIPSPGAFQYRGKADYHLRVSPNEPPVIGFMDVSNKRIIDIDRCEIVDETINEACLAFRRDLGSGRINTPWDRQTIWSADADSEKADVVTDFRRPRFVTRTVKGQNLTAPYRGFFQVNRFLVSRLVDDVVETSALNGRETVLDVYSWRPEPVRYTASKWMANPSTAPERITAGPVSQTPSSSGVMQQAPCMRILSAGKDVLTC
jgi:tRNA/tmRNA/rRNA uracil-C5-methylase (TrmA/RlmC/RlmD family)